MVDVQPKKRIARRKSRVLALQAIFALHQNNAHQSANAVIDFILHDVDHAPEDEFARLLANAAESHQAKLQVLIRAYAPDVEFSKMAPINKALLQLGLAEMRYFETPPVVVINEYVELAKMFGEASSAKLLNAVLDAFRENLGK